MTVYRHSGPRLFFFFFKIVLIVYLHVSYLLFLIYILLLREFEVEEMN